MAPKEPDILRFKRGWIEKHMTEIIFGTIFALGIVGLLAVVAS